MNNLFLILFFVSFIALIVGLIKPTTFSRFIKGELTRKKIAIIFGITTIASFVLFGITTDSSKNNNEVAQQPVVENTQVVTENKNENSVPVVEKTKTDTTPAPAKKETKTTPTTTPTPTPAPQTDRASMLVILKANASSKWGTDYQMVQYEYNNQVQAYDWVVAQTKYPAIMAKAKNKWSNDYQMVKYEYNNQVEAYEWIVAQTAYPNIMASAKQKWGDNYQMVKYEYNNQVQAYQGL